MYYPLRYLQACLTKSATRPSDQQRDNCILPILRSHMLHNMVINNEKNHKHTEKWQTILKEHEISFDNSLMELDISQISSSNNSTVSSHNIIDKDDFMFDSESYSQTDTQTNFSPGQHLGSGASSHILVCDEYYKQHTKCDDEFSPSQTDFAESLDKFILNGLIDQTGELERGLHFTSHESIEDFIR